MSAEGDIMEEYGNEADWTVPPMLNSSNASNATGSTAEEADLMEIIWLRSIFIFLYCAVFLLGISGNSLVVYVVVSNRSMQTITNVFIANLAISDIMMCLLAAPFTPLSGLLKSWVFGDVLCHIVPMTLGVSVHVSTLTSTAIAVDRFFVIVYPLRPRMKISACLVLIGAIWLLSISISLPLAIFQQVTFVPEEDIYMCHEHWPSTTIRQMFTVGSLALQYLVPCTIITFCYSSVSAALRMRAKLKLGSGSSNNNERHQMEILRKRRTNQMLIAMVSIFVCCWLPLNLIHLTLEYWDALEMWKYFLLLFFTAHVIAISSTIYNPFLYGWMNENFRKEFHRVLPCLVVSPFTQNGSRRSNRFRLARRSQRDGSFSMHYTIVNTNAVTRQPSVDDRANICDNGNVGAI